MLTLARRLVVVHAHPDDETLWTGGMIARYAAVGVTDQRFLGGIGRWRDSGMVVQPGARASMPPNHRSAVLAAMRTHGTQITVWAEGSHQAFALFDGVARPVLGTEYLTLARGPAEGAHDDLFGGLPHPAVA